MKNHKRRSDSRDALSVFEKAHNNNKFAIAFESCPSCVSSMGWPLPSSLDLYQYQTLLSTMSHPRITTNMIVYRMIMSNTDTHIHMYPVSSCNSLNSDLIQHPLRKTSTQQKKGLQSENTRLTVPDISINSLLHVYDGGDYN